MSKFKAGDLVEIVAGCDRVKLGMKGKVIAVDAVDFIASVSLQGVQYNFSFGSLRLVDSDDKSPSDAVNVADSVKSPSHYLMYGVETITIIARNLTQEEWRGYCLGNTLKYRLRAGKKGEAATCLAKADFYEELYETHKELCKK